MGARRHHVGEQLQLITRKHRDERLHAFGRDTGGDLLQQLRDRPGRSLPDELRCGGPYPFGEQQLPARRCVQLVGGRQGALVGDREGADLRNLITPELHPQRMVSGGRKDIDDPATHGKLAAAINHVDPGVGQIGQPSEHAFEVVQLPDLQPHRRDLAEAGEHRLDQRPHGRDDNLQRGGSAFFGVCQPTQHRQPPAHGVGSGGQPLVRQRLPGRQLSDHAGA